MSKKYHLIDALGLEHWDEGGTLGHVLKADDLERVLQNGIGVHGYQYDDTKKWTFEEPDSTIGSPTHMGRVVGLRPINCAHTLDVKKLLDDGVYKCMVCHKFLKLTEAV